MAKPTAFELAVESLPEPASLMIDAAAGALASGYSLPLIVIEAGGGLTVIATDFQDDDGKRFAPKLGDHLEFTKETTAISGQESARVSPGFANGV